MAALRILTLLALTLIAGVSSSYSSECSYYNLLDHLKLTSSNHVLETIQPVKNWTTPTEVLMDMLIYGILNVNEKSQTVTSHVWIEMRWENEFLTWNSSDFCGIDILTIPRSSIWIPDISIQEDASDAGSFYAGTLVSLLYTGFVYATARQVLTYTCQFNLSLFPFDTQCCNITFSSMSYNDQSIKLGTIRNDTALTTLSEMFMITQGEWELKDMEIINHKNSIHNFPQNKLVYMVTIKRKPMLYVINLIVPLFYLLVLDLSSFFISEARGEKLSFKVTILLSISVLLLILRDMLPSTEDKLPMIANYFVSVFALVGISVLEAMLVSFLIDLESYCVERDESSENDQVDIQLEAVYHNEAAAEDKSQGKPEKCYLPLDWPSDGDLLTLILNEVRAARHEAGRQHKDKKKLGHYRRLAEIIDHVFFVLYFLTVVVFLTYMYMAWVSKV